MKKEYRRYLIVYPDGNIDEVLISEAMVPAMENDPASLDFIRPGYREIQWAGDVTTETDSDLPLPGDCYRLV